MEHERSNQGQMKLHTEIFCYVQHIKTYFIAQRGVTIFFSKIQQWCPSLALTHHWINTFEINHEIVVCYYMHSNGQSLACC